MRPRIVAKIVAVAAFAVTGCFALMPAERPAALAAELADANAQAGVYRANCARCHGNDGHANTPKGRETDADDLTTGKVKGMAADKIARIIRNGKGDMPGFKKLTTAQINSLVRYVKSL